MISFTQAVGVCQVYLVNVNNNIEIQILSKVFTKCLNSVPN